MSEADLPLTRRLWIYQSERFPLAKTTMLLVVFAAAGVSASAHFAGRSLPGLDVFMLAIVVTLAFFFQLRVFDEIKDAEDDAKYRPERPIPRGLVSLGVIVRLGLASVPLVLAACLLIVPASLGLVLLTWAWMVLMGFEFFVPDWLKTHPLVYLASHMAIMPLIDLFVTGTEWSPHGNSPPWLALFLALSFVNGCILEIGRKLWAAEHEREGVDTYSALYGPVRAVGAWMGCVVLALALLTGVGFATGAPLATFVIGLLAAIFTMRAGMAYRFNPAPPEEKAVDNAAGLWVFACYFAAGFAPFIRQVIP